MVMGLSQFCLHKTGTQCLPTSSHFNRFGFFYSHAIPEAQKHGCGEGNLSMEACVHLTDPNNGEYIASIPGFPGIVLRASIHCFFKPSQQHYEESTLITFTFLLKKLRLRGTKRTSPEHPVSGRGLKQKQLGSRAHTPSFLLYCPAIYAMSRAWRQLCFPLSTSAGWIQGLVGISPRESEIHLMDETEEGHSPWIHVPA